MMLAMRCIGHEQHGNIVSAGDRMEVEVRSSARAPITILLEECLHPLGTTVPGTHRLADIRPLPLQSITIEIPKDSHTGYYYLTAISGKNLYSTSLYVNSTEEYSVAVIYPLFTQWAYHADGFYPNHDKLFWEKCAVKLGKSGKALFSLLGVKTTPRFPYNPCVSLKGYYRTNRRWQKSRDMIIPGSHREGLWFDDQFVTVPILSWLNTTNTAYKFFSDLNLHNGNLDILKSQVVIFLGQEAFTEQGMIFVKQLIQANKPCLFVGIQALGYRQYGYDVNNGELCYKATRGEFGLWGEKLEPEDPVWSPEGNIFGFQFPSPPNKNWRYDKPLKGWTIHDLGTPIFRGVQQTYFEYKVVINNSEHPILTYLGGEYLERFSKDAEVLACLDDEKNLIGCGQYKNNIFITPTYWPFIGHAERSKHPEIFIILTNALKWLIDKETRFCK